jgi:3-dehydroquinate synthase
MTHETRSVTVALDGRAYDIVIGRGVLADAGRLIAERVAPPLAVTISDTSVAKLYLEALQRSLEAAGVATRSYVVPAGEGSKSFAELERLCGAILDDGLERGAAIVALGGGVVGDLAGFAASVLLRGIDLVQVPTTLLSQVDSSVGGKTGINTPQGKNLVGAFYQPKLVLCDTDSLDTLPRRELLAGYAEVAKYGLVRDARFFTWLEEHGPDVIEGIGTARAEAVERSCRHKAEVVAGDEREQAGRALLNLGHTFGHALEHAVGFDERLLHGEAVAIGCVMAFDLSARLGLCPVADAARVRRHFAAMGLPTGLDSVPGFAWSVEALVDAMYRDKKVRGGRPVFILARGIGDAFISREVDLDAVRGLLVEAIAA